MNIAFINAMSVKPKLETYDSHFFFENIGVKVSQIMNGVDA